MTLKRLLPATVVAFTLASSAPFLAPAMAHAAPGPPPAPREHVRPADPGRIAALLPADTTRGIRLQGVATT